MTLKLNIYEKRKIVKTYTTEDIFIETGICEDVLQLVDIEKFVNVKDRTALAIEILKIVTKSLKPFKELIVCIFDGVTMDELRHTRIEEIAGVIMQIVIFTVDKLNSIGVDEKKM